MACPSSTVLTALFRQSYSVCPVCLPCPGCSGLAVPFWLNHSLAESFWLSCFSCPVRAVFFCCPLLFILLWLSYFSSPVLGSPVLAVLCWQSCTGSSVLTALFCLSKLRSAKKCAKNQGARKPRRFFLLYLRLLIMQMEVFRLFVCWRRNKRKLFVFKRTRRTCPSMPICAIWSAEYKCQ